MCAPVTELVALYTFNVYVALALSGLVSEKFPYAFVERDGTSCEPFKFAWLVKFSCAKTDVAPRSEIAIANATNVIKAMRASDRALKLVSYSGVIM